MIFPHDEWFDSIEAIILLWKVHKN